MPTLHSPHQKNGRVAICGRTIQFDIDGNSEPVTATEAVYAIEVPGFTLVSADPPLAEQEDINPALAEANAQVVAFVVQCSALRTRNSELVEALNKLQVEHAQIKAECDSLRQEIREILSRYPDRRRSRRKEYDSARKWGQVTRDSYEGKAAERRERARSLRTEGLSYQAIAEEMTCSVDAVRSLLRQVRSQCA